MKEQSLQNLKYAVDTVLHQNRNNQFAKTD